MKKAAFIVLIGLMLFGITGCGNQQFIDTTYTYEKAIIRMPDQSILEVEIDSWRDYSDGDQMQIKAKDGKTYLVHSANCVLITK